MPAEKRIRKGLWWDRNWPVLEGCTPCSPACDNCFAAEYAHRFEGSLPYLRGLTTQEGKWNGNVIMRQDQLDLPLKTKKPTVWFVAERSDLFHPAVADEYLDRIFAVMAMCPQHTFMVLTKRVGRMLAHLSGLQLMSPGIIPNLWLGVTAENQEQADKRIPLLLQAPVEHRFVSIEPMLSGIEISPYFWPQRLWMRDQVAFAEKAHEYQDCMVPMLDWVICGGESGRNARPVHPDWVRALRDQCIAAGVPFLFKQWGEYRPAESISEATNYPIVAQNRQQCADKMAREMPAFSGCYRQNHQVASILDGSGEFAQFDCAMVRSGKKAAGRLLDGKEHLEFPRYFAC